MELFSDTALWVVALGKTTFHSLWIGLLILALLRVTLLHIPVKFSNLRYGITVSGLLLLFCSIVVAFIVLYEPVTPLQNTLISRKSTFSLLLDWPVVSNGKQVVDTSLLYSIFAYIYFAGALFMLCRSAASAGYMRGLRNNGTPIASEWQARFNRIRISLGIRRSVKFLESARVKGPMLVGFLKPAVIVPAGMITHIPVGQIETILMHELYHLKRRDHLVNIMQLFIEGVLFYNPAVWIISDYIRNEREHCCDDGVLHAIDNPLIYARALIHIAEQQQFTRLAPGAVGTTRNHFYSRIKRILNRDTMKTNMRDKVISFALLAGSIILLLTVSGFSAGPSIIMSNHIIRDISATPVEQALVSVPDTIPLESEEAEPDQEREAARQEALEEIEEIDWEEIREDMKIDMESIRAEIGEIDWEEVKLEMEQSLSEMRIDMEEMKREIENSMNEIDWDEIREEIRVEMEKTRVFFDSLKIEMDH